MRALHVIGEEPVESASGETFVSIDPHDGSTIADVALGRTEDVDRAVRAARSAFPRWSSLGEAQRARLLHALADRIDGQAEALARLETRDCGKPIRQARADVARSAVNLRFFADYAAGVDSESWEGPARHTYVRYEPAGVAGCISPWNFPLMQATWKLAPALAFGCTVVLKPAEQTPLTASRLGELALEAGLPPGTLNVVQGLGPDGAGEALTRHADVNRVTFTGETRTGRAILAAVAETLKPVSFELGGKSANVVFADADLDAAVPGSVTGVFHNAGQVCLAGSRILVERSILDEFVARFVEQTRGLVVGDPKLEETEVGPLVEEQHLGKVRSYVELGVREGAALLCGGDTPADPGLAGGNYLMPAVFSDATNAMRISREEIFGPVAVIVPFEAEADAVAIANDSPYGLAGMVWTRDLARLGSANRCAVFQHDYLEILARDHAAPDGPAAHRIDRWLARREGAHIVCFGCGDASVVDRRLAASGLRTSGVVALSRRVDTEAGPATARFERVLLEQEDTPEGLVQAAHHQTPALIHQKRYLGHPNGVIALAEVILAADDPGALKRRYARLVAREPDAEGAFVLPGGSRLSVVSARDANALLPGAAVASPVSVAALSLAAADVAAVARRLAEQDIPHALLAGGRLIVPSDETHGVALVFEPADGAAERLPA